MTNPYQPSKTEAEPTTEGYMVSVPGLSAPVQVILPGFFRGWAVLVHGVPASKQGWLGKRLLRTDEGQDLIVRYMESLTGPVLLVAKQKFPVGPRHPAPLGALAFLPFALCFGGGAIGGLCGAAAWVTNRKIASSDKPMSLKIALMLGTTLLATAIVLALATAIQIAIKS